MRTNSIPSSAREQSKFKTHQFKAGRFKPRLSAVLVASLLACCLTSPALAQQVKAPLVTATVTTEQVRFVTPAEVWQMRLEIFSASGERLYDSDFRFGNLLDWPAQEQRLADGSYRCVVTVKNLFGRPSQRQGTILVQAGQVSLQTAEGEQSTNQRPDHGLCHFGPQSERAVAACSATPLAAAWPNRRSRQPRTALVD